MSAGKTEGMNKKFTAGGTVTLGAIVKLGSDDDSVIVAAAATDLLIGVALNAAASGEDVIVAMSGIADVKAGGTITRGAVVTAGAAGVGVAGAATNRLIGFATKAAASGDLVPVMISVGMHT